MDLSGADVYNNTAGTAADDICSDAKSTMTLGPVGDSWVLDDCSGVDSGAITGWYDDSANARWNAHDGDGAYHVQAVADFNGDAPATHTGTLCLKAAHNAYATLTPADITIYMGGNDGYDGVLSGTDATTSNSLPEPGFYFTLPQDLNQVLSDAMGVDPSAAIDLSGKVNVTAIAGGADRQWTLERYGAENGTSTAMVDADGVEHFIYRIVPADGQDPIRVAFTDTETGETITSDAFDPSNALYKQYEIRLYTGQVEVESISMQFTVPGADGAELTYSCGYDAAGSTPGTLTVRYASDSAAMTPAAVGEAGLQQAVAADAGSFHVQVADGQTFYLNETDHTAAGVTVAHSDVSLLADTLVSGENYAYVSALYEKTLTKAGFARATVDSAYLDLVDADNGNAWLTPAQGETVTVFWPYRSGMDQNSELKLYHFEGLDRTMETADVANEIAGTEPAEVEITKGEYGITFTTDSFSPFVLVCDTSEPDTGDTGDTDDTDDTGDDGNNTSNTTRNQNTVTSTATGTATAAASAAIPQTGDDMPVGLLGGLAALAAGGLAALLALRKRRGAR